MYLYLAIGRGSLNLLNRVNDLLSIKNELAQDSIDSLIPLMYLHTGNIQAAVEVTSFLHSEIQCFDYTAQLIFSRYKFADEESQNQLRNYVTGCRQYCTGNLIWR
ncbi:hypothetical protein AOQ84DRAFT_423061 [Glonium stellatum]|uniref:Uncharacterized protein n=1 Tax=Glonium stellatum TaxID=574774 RepID=A0A8E2EPS7_9PEZI|nr:hypothetical protein AOQ84DRAFT_423061 [Glonium stellatum]